MDIRKLQRVIVDGLEDVKAQNIVVFNTEHLSPLFERVIVASGTSNRQTKSLAASVRDAVRAAGAPPPRTEGEDNGEWIIVDCGAAVVHVMQPAIRDYYHLEELWGDKPVRMKIGAPPSPRLVKAAPVPPARAERRASPRPPGEAPASAKRPARSAASAKGAARPAAPAKRAARPPAPAKRAARPPAPAKRIVRTVGVKRPAAKKAAGQR
jgi:ribosome-associated protein